MFYVYRALQKSFTPHKNKWIGIFVFVGSFLLSIWVNNSEALISYLSLDSSFIDKIRYLGNYTVSSFEELSFGTLLSTSFLFALFSVNTVLFIHIYHTARHLFGKAHLITTSGIGFLVSLVGIGCFSCGAFFLTYILSIVGASSLLVILPFKGVEIIVAGFVVLCISIFILSKKLVTLGQ